MKQLLNAKNKKVLSNKSLRMPLEETGRKTILICLY